MAAALHGILGCSSEDSSTTAAPSGLAPTSIKGLWKSGCVASGDFFELKSINFTEKSFTFESTITADSSCTEVIDKIDGQGEYLLGPVQSIAQFGTATQIDYTFFSYTWTFLDAPKDAIDIAKACGDAEVSGNVVSVLGKTCDLTGEAAISFHSPAYGVIAVNSDGKLLLTDSSSNGGTKEERSTSLRINAGWEKVEEETAAEE
jgi:hypothetical protein